MIPPYFHLCASFLAASYLFVSPLAAQMLITEPESGSVPNLQPVARADSLGTFQDTSLTVSTSRLLANDSDPDGGMLSVTSVTSANGPDSGTVSLSGTMVTYVPKSGFLG